MPLHLVTPFDTDPETDAVERHHPNLGRLIADGLFILIRSTAFLASIYLGVLGLPLLFFLALTGGDMTLFFAQLGNLSAHYLEADDAARAAFLGQVRLGLFGIATLIALWRLPVFLAGIARSLHEADAEQ